MEILYHPETITTIVARKRRPVTRVQGRDLRPAHQLQQADALMWRKDGVVGSSSSL